MNQCSDCGSDTSMPGLCLPCEESRLRTREPDIERAIRFLYERMPVESRRAFDRLAGVLKSEIEG